MFFYLAIEKMVYEHKILKLNHENPAKFLIYVNYTVDVNGI